MGTSASKVKLNEIKSKIRNSAKDNQIVSVSATASKPKYNVKTINCIVNVWSRHLNVYVPIDLYSLFNRYLKIIGGDWWIVGLKSSKTTPHELNRQIFQNIDKEEKENDDLEIRSICCGHVDFFLALSVAGQV